MNKKLICLSIAATISLLSMPALSQSNLNEMAIRKAVENVKLENNIIEDDYKRRLEMFLNDESVEENTLISSEKKINIEDENNLENNTNEVIPLENINYIENETKIVNSETIGIEDDFNLKINNILESLNLLRSEFEAYDKIIKNDYESYFSNRLSDLKLDFITQVESEIAALQKAQEGALYDIDKLKEKDYSQDIIDLKISTKSINEEIDNLHEIIVSKVDEVEFNQYKNSLNEDIKSLKLNFKNEMKNLSIEKDLEELKLTLGNEIETNNLLLKEKGDEILDLKKNSNIDFINFSSVLNKKFDALEQDKEAHNKKHIEDVDNLKERVLKLESSLKEKDLLIDKQNKKINDLNKNYLSLSESVEKFKSMDFTKNIIDVNGFENLKEAKKSVSEEGGLLILDKNGQVKVLN
jgi:hypothetical protein